MAVLLETTLGDVVIDLYTEERPRACLNFLKLCKIKYYNYCLIHNVQRDFIIQTGDPTGTGRGGESIFGQLYGDQASFFEAEKVPRIKHKKKGTVSMVNNGSDQHGSQFLITTGENLDYLDGVHTVFGEVTEGMDIVKKINETFVDKDFVPYQDIRINHTVILDDPFDDPPDLLIPDRSPEPTKEQLDSGRIGADEEIDDFKGRSAEEVEEIKAEKEAKTQAILLEMVGDLPDADIKPPENVLFVCKLNPVTTDEDLEIIFSRFGPIRSCEVIRDWKTGESLCYAFIEFEKEEDCEKAFFKMDNVLIDDPDAPGKKAIQVMQRPWGWRAPALACAPPAIPPLSSLLLSFAPGIRVELALPYSSNSPTITTVFPAWNSVSRVLVGPQWCRVSWWDYSGYICPYSWSLAYAEPSSKKTSSSPLLDSVPKTLWKEADQVAQSTH